MKSTIQNTIQSSTILIPLATIWAFKYHSTVYLPRPPKYHWCSIQIPFAIIPPRTIQIPFKYHSIVYLQRPPKYHWSTIQIPLAIIPPRIIQWYLSGTFFVRVWRVRAETCTSVNKPNRTQSTCLYHYNIIHFMDVVSFVPLPPLGNTVSSGLRSTPLLRSNSVGTFTTLSSFPLPLNIRFGFLNMIADELFKMLSSWGVIFNTSIGNVW